MIGRLWFPQLDVYDTIRRIGGLLCLWGQELPSAERLFIADFYMANPPLLHKTHMTQGVRRAFGELAVARPEKGFVQYPSPPLLFQKMDEVQREALRTISGKGLIDVSALDNGAIRPSETGRALFETNFLPMLSKSERRIGDFLVKEFASVDKPMVTIRQSTGLRRLVR
jgi:hypothetical protein